MRFLDLKEALKNYTVFTPSDIKKLGGSFFGTRLNEWQKKGYIKKVLRGYYIFSDLSLNEKVYFLVANKIYNPSYVSLESALSYYGVIPEAVYSVTSVTTKKTSQFLTSICSFYYRKINPKLFFGYNLLGEGSSVFKMASLEKAICDYFYFNSDLNSKSKIEDKRFNLDVLKEKLNRHILLKYLSLYNKNTQKRVSGLISFIYNDD
ncbi:MAG: hypothetical protein ABIJ36_01740 [Patescibacteria group bacterium]|nr:hypothetical protein [Patescibacteria group bacterium]